MDDPVQVGRMKNVLVRSLAFPALVAAGVVVLALGLMLASLGRNLHALAPLEVHLAAIRRIQLQSLDMQYALVRDLRGEESLDPARLNAQRNALFALARDPDLLSAQARDAITDAHALFATGTLPPQTVLRDAVTLMHEAAPTLFDVRRHTSTGQDLVTLDSPYREWYGYPAQGLLVLTLPLDVVIDVVAAGGVLLSLPFVYGVRALQGESVSGAGKAVP